MMKKKFLICLLVSVMALSFAVPTMAVAAPEPINAVVEYEGIAPLNEMTRIYWRTYNGILQFRVWSITNGRWLTNWTNFYLI